MAVQAHFSAHANFICVGRLAPHVAARALALVTPGAPCLSAAASTCPLCPLHTFLGVASPSHILHPAVFPVAGRLLAWHSLPRVAILLPRGGMFSLGLCLAPGLFDPGHPPLAPCGAQGPPSLGACLLPTTEMQLVVAPRPISIGVLRTQFNLVCQPLMPFPSPFSGRTGI